MKRVHPTISKDMSTIWDHKWFVKIYVIYYRLSLYDSSNCFLKNHSVVKKQKLYYTQFYNRIVKL